MVAFLLVFTFAIIFDSHIFLNSHCNNDQWHEYIITIDKAATKVRCDNILIHVDSSKTSLYGPANKYHRMHVLLGAQSLSNSTQCRMNGLFKNFEAYHVEFESVRIPEVWCDET